MSHATTNKSKRISTASILAASFILYAGRRVGWHAQAAEALRYDRALVAYGDLNLDSQLGTKVLYARLRNGAEDVCSSMDGRNLFLKRLWQSCFDEAVAAAVVQVNQPGLTALHNHTVNRLKGDR